MALSCRLGRLLQIGRRSADAADRGDGNRVYRFFPARLNRSVAAPTHRVDETIIISHIRVTVSNFCGQAAAGARSSFNFLDGMISDRCLLLFERSQNGTESKRLFLDFMRRVFRARGLGSMNERPVATAQLLAQLRWDSCDVEVWERLTRYRRRCLANSCLIEAPRSVDPWPLYLNMVKRVMWSVREDEVKPSLEGETFADHAELSPHLPTVAISAPIIRRPGCLSPIIGDRRGPLRKNTGLTGLYGFCID